MEGLNLENVIKLLLIHKMSSSRQHTPHAYTLRCPMLSVYTSIGNRKTNTHLRYREKR